MSSLSRLPFEKEIYALEDLLASLETKEGGEKGSSEEIRRIRKEIASLKKTKFNNLTAWETVQVSRHPDRPQLLDYVEMIFEDFVELHGDRAFGDDRALRTGFARVGEFRVMLMGHQKGHTLQERQECMYGCAHPEGYRKALKNMKLAEKFNLPVICLIDTPGAFPGIGAEERGQSALIANNILEMTRLATPVICVVIGEGGSGGALGIGVGDRVCMLEFAYYSVISPEGCAGILWKTANETTKPTAAEALRLTSRDLSRLGVVDHVIMEPLGGAHRDPKEIGNTLKASLLKMLRELVTIPVAELLEQRYMKFRKMGVYLENESQNQSAGSA
ncbi:MAG: acetyl-CoA carboxylase carboxyltransferase subunit alpha [Gemmataceae bacterium]|nr:acetyl-CoA carboxylase carboxyltransferase subunit alpha [Gemmataceae bacterium]